MNIERIPVKTASSDEVSARSFKELLGEFQAGLETELHSWLVRKQEELTAEVAEADELVSRLDQYVLRGGKRLRPALVYYSFVACGGSSRESVMPASLAVELLHTYLLIHDDIMDRAPTRRGEPTAHLVFRDDHLARGWSGNADHHGESAAILLGDLAHCYAEELFAAARSDEADQARLRACFAGMCQEVITGQYLEFTAGQREGLTEEDLLQILRMKSGRYSVERPIQLGAQQAGAPDSLLENLSKFGLLLGEAFQLHDDLLGMFGETKTVGKPVGGDLVEGKYTLLVHRALSRAEGAEAEQLRSALGNESLSEAEIESAIEIISSTGARESVTRMVDERHREAADLLAGLDLEAQGKSFLAGLVEYLRERSV
jgi:geranylgeranyl diphosphate synthase type I